MRLAHGFLVDLEADAQSIGLASQLRPLLHVHGQSEVRTAIQGVLVVSNFLTHLSKDQVTAETESGTLVKIDSCIPNTVRTIGAITRRDQIPTRL